MMKDRFYALRPYACQKLPWDFSLALKKWMNSLLFFLWFLPWSIYKRLYIHSSVSYPRHSPSDSCIVSQLHSLLNLSTFKASGVNSLPSGGIAQLLISASTDMPYLTLIPQFFPLYKLISLRHHKWQV